jgi:hypothetical protein
MTEALMTVAKPRTLALSVEVKGSIRFHNANLSGMVVVVPESEGLAEQDTFSESSR